MLVTVTARRSILILLLVFIEMIIEIWILASRYASVQAPWPLFPYCLRMPVLLAVAVLFFMQIVGEALARFTGLPLPGPLLGMLLMLAALMAYGRDRKSTHLNSSH